MSKERDPATYTSVMDSSLLSNVCKVVYWAMWGRVDGLTRGELSSVCTEAGYQEETKNSWSKALSELSKMGLVEKADKRHCPVASKPDQVWEVTNKATPVKPKAPKPSAKAYVRSVEQLEMIMHHHSARGDGMVTDDLHKLFNWLKDKITT
jgi:hypothetical protein